MVEPDSPTGNHWNGAPEGDLLRIALERGFVTESEVQEARTLQDRQARRDQYQPLVQVLVEAGALTTHQAGRIAAELKNSGEPDQIPGYRFLERVGEGSMGVVYKAEQLSLGRIVAVKILSRHLTLNKDFIDRLETEARIGAALANAHIPQIHQRGEAAGQHYLVMEFVEGTSAGKVLDAGERFVQREALHIAVQAAEALAYLHSHEIVHRDVKPHNLVITREGVVKLMDLGLARHIHDEQRISIETGNAIGTPFYISPEQIIGARDVDGRSDLYALGGTLYHMLTGTPPFKEGSSVDILQAHLKQQPKPPTSIRPSLAPEVEEVILRLMVKHPAKRYQSAKELNKELIRLQRRLYGPGGRLHTGGAGA